MEFRPRFRLRTLFVITTIIAIISAWFAAQRVCIANRNEALQWAIKYKVNREYDKTPNVPWGLWIAGERRSVSSFMIDENKLPEAERRHIDDLKRVFPEAAIIENRDLEVVVIADPRGTWQHPDR